MGNQTPEKDDKNGKKPESEKSQGETGSYTTAGTCFEVIGKKGEERKAKKTKEGNKGQMKCYAPKSPG